MTTERVANRVACLLLWVVGIANSATPVMPWDPSLARPLARKDPRTSITFYVESDGKHVAAIDAQGKLLWVRSPFQERDPSDTRLPMIAEIEVAEPPAANYAKILQRYGFKADHAYIRISFASLAFGLMDERTGDFILEGIN